MGTGPALAARSEPPQRELNLAYDRPLPDSLRRSIVEITVLDAATRAPLVGAEVFVLSYIDFKYRVIPTDPKGQSRVVYPHAGKPWLNIEVSVMISSISRNKELFLQTWTDSTGRFRWESAPAGKVELSMGKEGYLWIEDAPFTAGEQEKVVVLKPGLTVTIKARDSRTGQPIKPLSIETGIAGPDADTTIWKPESLRVVTDGEFRTALDAGAGPYRFRVRSAGYEATASRVIRGEEKDVEEVIDLGIQEDRGPMGMQGGPVGRDTAHRLRPGGAVAESASSAISLEGDGSSVRLGPTRDPSDQIDDAADFLDVHSIPGHVRPVTWSHRHRPADDPAGGRAEVDLINARPRDDRGQVTERKPATGEDGNPAARSLDEPPQRFDAFQGRGSSSRGEDAVDAQGDERVEGSFEVGRLVESLVERDAHGTGQVDECGGLLAVDRRVRLQEPDHDAGRAELAGELDLVPHRGQLGFAVDEVTPARADQDVHRDTQPAASLGDCPRARGRAPHRQVVAELDPVGPPLPRRERRFEVAHADLDGDLAIHECLETSTGKTRVRVASQEGSPQRTQRTQREFSIMKIGIINLCMIVFPSVSSVSPVVKSSGFHHLAESATHA
jgi:hypothetical protein